MRFCEFFAIFEFFIRFVESTVSADILKIENHQSTMFLNFFLTLLMTKKQKQNYGKFILICFESV
jgi:hypothetical protein